MCCAWDAKAEYLEVNVHVIVRMHLVHCFSFFFFYYYYVFLFVFFFSFFSSIFFTTTNSFLTNWSPTASIRFERSHLFFNNDHRENSNWMYVKLELEEIIIFIFSSKEIRFSFVFLNNYFEISDAISLERVIIRIIIPHYHCFFFFFFFFLLLMSSSYKVNVQKRLELFSSFLYFFFLPFYISSIYNVLNICYNSW